MEMAVFFDAVWARLGCCLVSLHILCDILATVTVGVLPRDLSVSETERSFGGLPHMKSAVGWVPKKQRKRTKSADSCT